MLISEPKVSQQSRDPIFSALAGISGRSASPSEIRPGVYEIGHFGSSHFLRDEYERYPDLPEVGSYGVCDSIENLLEKAPVLQQPGRDFVVTLTRVCKDDEPAEGGWRWHKWGPYIGAHEPQCEYIHDEPVVEEVFCYHIYERRQPRG